MMKERGIFMCSDKHPANDGLDFSFDGFISETVLRNYLSRAMTLGFFNPIHFEPEQHAYRMQCRDVIRTCLLYTSRCV